MFRLDRFLTLYFFRSLLKKIPKSKELGIPILMYHSISNDKIKNMHPYYETNTTLADFSGQMKFLYENDYSVISLFDAIQILSSQHIMFKGNNFNQSNLSSEIHAYDSEANLTGSNPSNNKRINFAVITFDDGFHSFYADAYPILEKYGFTADVFLPTAYLGDENVKFKSKKCMSWGEVRELYRFGISFGSHTVNHPVLYEMKKIENDYELRYSKRKMEDEIGGSITSFSYPFAFPGHDYKFVRMFRDLLIKNGYEVGVTTQIGKATIKDGTFFMKRLPVNSFDDINFFRAKLEGAYDWVYHIQKMFKSLKPLLKKR